MKKRIFTVVMIMLIVSTSFMGCNKKKELKESTKIKATPTPEACEFINEWDSTLFEVFGFESLNPPIKSHYPEIEKGRTYVKGQFIVDDYDAFESFFCNIYRIMWGEILDASQVLKKEGDVYSFDDEYVVTEIFRAAINKERGNIPRAEKYAWIGISYDESTGKCEIECRMLVGPSKK